MDDSEPNQLAPEEQVQSLNPMAVGGGMDLLADSAFYRGAGATDGGPRASYKQALLKDGYQKLSNSAFQSLRASRLGRMSASGPVRGRGAWNLTPTTQLNGSLRKSH